MVQQAARADDPMIFLEPKRRYWEKALVDRAAEPGPLHSARVVRQGSDVTLAAYGPMVHTCIEAASAADDEGVSLAVIDLRTLSPLDLHPVLESVRSTGRLVVVHEAPSNCSLSAEVAAQVTEKAFFSLAAPVLRVTGFDIPYPPARFEAAYLPDVDRILDAVDRSRAY